MSSKDNLGDKLKDLEQAEAGRQVMRGLPVMARLDGRGFSNFTKGLKRPYDERMSSLMVATTKYLVEETHATVGYTQSDEITLSWHHDYESVSEYMFSGKIQKIVSTLSAMASVYFSRQLFDSIPEKYNALPTFDCRLWQVPNERLVYLNYLWREQDATKNSISMAAHEYFSNTELHKKNSYEKISLLEAQGVNWSEYPAFFKRGTYVQRKTFLMDLEQSVLDKIPFDKQPIDGKVTRSRVVDLDLPPLSTIANAADVLLRGEEFKLKSGV